ncbi:hypothetical protein [Kamptonema formosum]|uniref:hypothetical protein n=1 Tax=Kamptonema formosum TaxID=331992 RepID=UPI0003497EBA|nr:hypothetical protein [Oscillatoria sp. PCC 10802]
MSSEADTTKEKQGSEAQVRIRLLLMLWDLGEGKPVKKSELTAKVKQSGEDYKELEKEGAIERKVEKRLTLVSLTDKGLQMLAQELKNPEMKFGGTQVGSRVANALLKWIRKMDGAVSVPAGEGKPVVPAISSYEEFEPVGLEVYDRLNRDYNLDDLVPIYRMRREIGERVSREKFREWLLEMQANGIFKLQGGEMPDITPDKAEDSVKTSLGELRYYATHLSD